MEFNFKKFENTNQRFEDRISVTGTNSFGFPTKFYQDNHLDQYKYAAIFYDADNKAVGINFNNDENDKHKFSLLKSKKGYGANVIATSFFKSYNIDAKKYQGRYNWEIKDYPDSGRLFVIVLKEKVNSKTPSEVQPTTTVEPDTQLPQQEQVATPPDPGTPPPSENQPLEITNLNAGEVPERS